MSYRTWEFIVILCCIFSSYIYMFLAAFGNEESGIKMFALDVCFNVIFAIDIIVRK